MRQHSWRRSTENFTSVGHFRSDVQAPPPGSDCIVIVAQVVALLGKRTLQSVIDEYQVHRGGAIEAAIWESGPPPTPASTVSPSRAASDLSSYHWAVTRSGRAQTGDGVLLLRGVDHAESQVLLQPVV